MYTYMRQTKEKRKREWVERRDQKKIGAEKKQTTTAPETGIGIIENELKIDDTFVVHFFPL